MNLAECRTKIERARGTLASIHRDIKRESDLITELQVEVDHTRAAQQIIQIVAESTQGQLEYRVSELVTLSMEYVFDDPYTISLKFVPKRGKTDCTLNFMRDGKVASPKDQSGYGAMNIAGHGARLSCMSLADPPPRPVLFLDEPFPNLKGTEANRRAIQMIKRTSKELGLQIIMVSDERAALEDIEDGADRIFHTSIVNGQSQLTVRDM